jgi:hypothetical protein
MCVPQVRSGFTHNEKDFLYVLRQREPSTPNSPNTYTVYMNYERCVTSPCVLPHVCWITRVLNGTDFTVPTPPLLVPCVLQGPVTTVLLPQGLHAAAGRAGAGQAAH